MEKSYERRNGFPLNNHSEQVIECLKLILNKALAEKARSSSDYSTTMETLYQLILKTYASKWEKKQKTHFEYLFPKLKDWNIFFLSYTNKDAGYVNKEYKEMIKEVIDEGQIRLSNEDWNNANLIAEVIIQRLRGNNYNNGFYDKTNLDQGDLLSKIETEAKKTLVFHSATDHELFCY